MYNIIKFDYYDDFKCLGADCKNSCCKGWEVTMSKSDYSHFKAAEYPTEVKNILNKSLKRIKDGSGNPEFRYAEFVLENGDCPFLDEGWCLLQKKCGEKALVDICRLFPRVATNTAGVVVKSCTLACEAVVTKLMKYKDGLKLCFEETSNEPDLLKGAFAINLNQFKIGKNKYIYYVDYFTLMFSLLQRRELKFSSRLLVLGMAFQEIQKACDEERLTDIPAITDKYINIDISGEIIETLEAFQLNVQKSKDLYCGIFMEVCNHTCALQSSRFVKKLENDETDPQKNIEQTKLNLEKLSEYLSVKMIYIENMMINEYACQHYPFTMGGLSLWDNYLLFSGIYNAYIMSLVEMAGDGMDDEKFATYTGDFFKLFSHNSGIKEIMLKLYKANSFDTLPALATLIQFF